jgi:hypothetical protein
MITSYLTQRDLSSARATEADGRAYLNELADDPLARERAFWIALINAAVEMVKDHSAIEDWPETGSCELGGGATLRQDSRPDGGDELGLWIERNGITWKLATVGYYNSEMGRYCWIRNATAYAAAVRGFRRALRTREAIEAGREEAA